MHLLSVLLTLPEKRPSPSARKEAETWPPELQLCSCWASSALSLQQVSRKVDLSPCLDRGQVRVRVRVLPAASHTFCICSPAAQVVLDCCKTKTSRFLPLQRIESYSVQDAGSGCDISATM